MDFENVTYEGPAVSDAALLKRLPDDLKAILSGTNGFVAFEGGVHFRGVCDSPAWHSLQLFWTGDKALSKRYPNVRAEDIPFAQDCMGDQFLLRGNTIFKLRGETGEVKDMKMGLPVFLEEAKSNPMVFLEMYPLQQLKNKGKKLEPGQLINPFPPFFTTQSGKNVSLRAVPALDQLHYLFDLSRQISNIPDGSRIEIKVVENRIQVVEIK